MPIKDKEQRNAYNREWYRLVGRQRAIDRAFKRKKKLVDKLRHYKSEQASTNSMKETSEKAP